MCASRGCAFSVTPTWWLSSSSLFKKKKQFTNVVVEQKRHSWKKILVNGNNQWWFYFSSVEIKLIYNDVFFCLAYYLFYIHCLVTSRFIHLHCFWQGISSFWQICSELRSRCWRFCCSPSVSYLQDSSSCQPTFKWNTRGPDLQQMKHTSIKIK